MVHGILYLSYFSLGLIQLMASTHSEEQLTQLIYVSERKSDVDDAEVQSILETARKNNDQSGIKGVLLVLPDYFFQVLEGPSNNIEKLISRVKNDTRHCNIRILSEKVLCDYEFGNWSMVNIDINAENSDCFVVLDRFAKAKCPADDQLKGVFLIFKGLSQPIH
ncbi:hypothetical protein AltI4_03660 [Alteromonas sp. I4]|nr:hypothetical protein AltI4_03660 [Alteromonas sp. I4]